MRIDNNYTQRQPNFGKLGSIKYDNWVTPKDYPKEITKLMQTIKESPAFNDFFQKYDVNLHLKTNFFDFDIVPRVKNVSLILKTKITRTKDDWYPELLFKAQNRGFFDIDLTTAFDRLTKKIKKVKTSDLEDKLFKLLKEKEEKEKRKNLVKKCEVEIDKIINDINSGKVGNGAQPTKTKNNLFDRLFGWIK